MYSEVDSRIPTLRAWEGPPLCVVMTRMPLSCRFSNVCKVWTSVDPSSTTTTSAEFCLADVTAVINRAGFSL